MKKNGHKGLITYKECFTELTSDWFHIYLFLARVTKYGGILIGSITREALQYIVAFFTNLKIILQNVSAPTKLTRR